MENYYYKCSVCGYVHLVPAYWVSFSPEQQLEQGHINPKTSEMCNQMYLELMEEQETL